MEPVRVRRAPAFELFLAVFAVKPEAMLYEPTSTPFSIARTMKLFKVLRALAGTP